jgi:alpha-L-rhamnosidase
MNSLRLTLGILLLWPALVGISWAAPVPSPLAFVPDPVGAELQATFISAPADVASATRASFIAYRKTFVLSAAPRTASLHVFADARYLLWINGRPVHRGPNRFEIRGPQYDTVEIANVLHTGDNTLAIVVMGNDGTWQGGHNARMMKHAPGLTLRLDVDGEPLVRSDETWRWNEQTRYRPAKVDWAKIVDRIDARVEDGDWTLPDYDDRAWKSAVKIDGDTWGPLSARRMPLLRDTRVEASLAEGATLPVTLEAGQQLTFSMGRLVLAYTKIVLEAEEGTELSLGYAGIDYIARGGRQTYISSDSCAFDGGAITVKSGRATILALELVERLYPFDRVGTFRSSDPLLNRLWDVCARSLEILSEDAYVDCAERERAEWMDCDPPMFDLTRTAMSAPGPDGKPRYADARLLGEMLRRTALTQQKEGWVKAHTTSDRFDIHAHMEDRSCDWVQGARRYYESTGDQALIREIWSVIAGQMDYFLARRTVRGLVLAREWVVWGNPVGYVTCEGAGLNAFVYKALIDAAHLGKVIGETQKSAHFAAEAAALAAAFNAVLWNEQLGTYHSGYYAEADRAKADNRARGMKLKVENNLIEPTLFPALWALDQEIVPEERRARVTSYLLENRGQADRVMTFYYLHKQLYQADTDVFDREILSTYRTKWLPQIEWKWGTTWEEFYGASKAHCYGMFPGYFLSAYVLGVRTDLPAANRRVIIEPHLGDLASAEGVVVTEFGPVPISWTSTAGKLDFEFELPAGVSATLRLPAGAIELDEKSASGKADRTRFVTEIGPGRHRGTVTR